MALPFPEETNLAKHAALTPGRTLRWAERGLVAYGLAAAVLILLDVGGGPIPALKLIACLSVPGWAALSRARIDDPVARIVWTVGLSSVLYAIVAVIMAWTAFWQPRPAAAVILVASAATIAVRPGSLTIGRRRPLTGQPRAAARPNGILPWLLLGVAVLLWAVGLALAGHGPLDDFGLLTRLPFLWYAGLLLTIALCIWGVTARRMFSALLMSACLTSLVLMLYASASLLAAAPRFPWTYKHIAVTNLIGATGTVDPSIDIYNRWPGFFSLSAFLGGAMGYGNALDYASWAETGFALVDAALVLAIARTLTQRARIYWTAALVFTVTNWVNQNYYAPQSLAYSLYLALCLIALTFLRDTPARWVAAIEEWARGIPRVLRVTRRRPAALDTAWAQRRSSQQGWAIAAILVVNAVIVVSHQLTPYLAILGLTPLFIVGYFRARWLGPALVIQTVAFLIPNLDYIRGKYGLFSGFNIFANTGYKPPALSSANDGQWVFTGDTLAHGAVVLTLMAGILGIAGFIRRILQGKVRSTLVVAWLAFSPALGLLAQSYGGEARFRVYLFALPWLAIGVSWLFWSSPVRGRRAVVVAASALAVMSLLFTVVNFQPEAKYRVSKDDVAASQWLDAHIKDRDLVFDSKHFFPLLIGPNYPHYLKWGSVTSLLDYLKASNGTITVGRLRAYSDHMRNAANDYIIISDELKRWAVASNTPGGRYVAPLEGVLKKSNDAQVVYKNATVRIYRITGSGEQVPAPQ